ncbi:TetR/AcrR family transcriptional regulator [Humibacter soli]
MSDAPESGPNPRLTPRGAQTRARIVSAAAELMRVKGVDATTLDDVRAASGTSKSQLYRHYHDKSELVRDVIEFTGDFVIRREQERLGRVSSVAGLRRWRDALVQANDLQHGAYGCALGSLAGDVADHDALAREQLSRLFGTWTTLISGALSRMQERGTLGQQVDADYVANGLLAALQGGYLLAQAAGDSAPMASAIDMALDYIDSLAVKAS